MLKTVASSTGSRNLISLIHILIAILLISRAQSLTLTVVPAVRTINSVTNFDWTITGLTGTSTTVLLRFPAVVTFNATNPTTVETSSGTLYGGTLSFTGNNITITLIIAQQTNSTLFFRVTNIKNSPYQFSQNAWFYRNTASISSFVSFDKGSITDCSLSFTGTTDTTVSTAFLDFKTTNPISNNRIVFRISYSSYTLLTTTITQNNNITCSYSVNGGSLSSQSVATYPSPGSPIFDCSFSGVNLVASSVVRLRLSNVRNPPYKNNYLIDAFRVESLDGVYFYDSSPGCSLSQVQIDSYQALYTQSSKLVNTIYSTPKIQTIQQLSKNFAANDRIIIQHQNIQIPTIGAYLLLSRISSSYPAIQFSYISGNSSTPIITQSNVANSIQETKRIQIQLLNFGVKVPASVTPVTILFRFFRNYAANTSVTLEYLNIFAVLRPLAATFDVGDLIITPSTYAIGASATYDFKINISQPLSGSSYILLKLPLELDITQFTTTSTCILRSVDLNTNAACSIFSAENKIIQVKITAINGISAPQFLNITVGNIINADNPERSFSFGVETYYSQSDTTSQVQVGAGLTSITYSQRIMNIVAEVPNPGYTVDYFPSILTLTYIPGVKIPANLLIKFAFTSSISAFINYLSVTVGPSSLLYTKSQTNNSGQVTITLTVSAQIPINSVVVFKFEFKAPAIVSKYTVVLAQVRSSSGKLYEKQATSSEIDVAYPASQVFALTPLVSMTGVMTNYTLSFFTNVIHPTTFYLDIKFPADTFMSVTTNNTVKCAPAEVCRGVIIINSSPGSQQICLNLTSKNTTSNTTINTFNIIITNITNSRKIGLTNSFNILTLTNPPTSSNSSQILNGSLKVSIGSPNTGTAAFDLSKSYYRSNIQPVSMIMSFFNDLAQNDYIQVRFDYRTYVLASTGASGIQCTNVVDFACTFDSTQSTSFSTVIKVKPLSTTALREPITFAIQGLNSSSTTFPSQRFQIVIRTFSSDDRQMDQTKILYNISCATASILSKNCRTCNQNTSVCYSCYPGSYLYNQSCVADCGTQSQYKLFTNGSQCTNCINQCGKCISATQCLTCIPNYFLYQDSTCKSSCNLQNGYYVDTINNQIMCLKCWSSSCLQCKNGSSNACTNCGTAYQDPNNPGRCVDDCDLSVNYKIGSSCLPCNKRCIGCVGAGYTDCLVCRPGYYNVSGSCETTCPKYTVPMLDRTCSCSGGCGRCQIIDTRCLTCQDPNAKLYNYQCLNGCPNSSYQYFGSCIDCNTGCLTCTVNACLECLAGYNVYQNKCFTQCNSVGQRFSAVNGTCIQCPDGCDMCNGALECSVCLGNYTLIGTVCTKTCLLTNSCDPVNPVPDKILPLPGFIAASVWLVILIVLKLFFLNKIYLPYAYIFLGSIIQIVVSIAVLSKMNDKLQTLILNTTTSRLLQTVSNASIQKPRPYQYAVIGILATAIALNFMFNFVYLFLFCKYLKKYIPDRQIDKISNYLVVSLGTITNFRFSLLAYSKLFPKPNILVQNQSKLTPLHYMCIASIFTSFFPLSASCILIYNQYPLTDLFMLGIDLLMIVLISLVFTIWMVSVDKPGEYFQGMKKYSKEEVNNTMENINQKEHGNDNSNSSKHKISSVYNAHNMDNSVIHVEDLNEQISQKQIKNSNRPYNNKNNKSDNENQPLPNIPIRTSTVNIQKMKVNAKNNNNEDENLSDLDNQSLEDQKKSKIQPSFSERKTQRYNNNKTDMKKYEKKPNNVDDRHDNPIQGGIKNRNKESTKNFSKQKKFGAKKKDKANTNQDMNIKINDISGKNQANDESQYIEDSLDMNDLSMNKARSDILQKQKKPQKSQTQRSSGILPVTMKKKQSFGMFQSQKAASQIDQVDFQSLIQTKMVDKTKQKQNTMPTNLKQDQPQHEQISPSWFNQQNQRFDLDSSSDV